MAQISFFLTEYANGISAVCYAFTLILLLVALHRIRRIGKQIQEITGNIDRIAVQLKRESEVMEKAGTQMPEQPKTAVREERPEELIEAVLGEVFRNPA